MQRGAAEGTEMFGGSAAFRFGSGGASMWNIGFVPLLPPMEFEGNPKTLRGP
ncbi:hypothetical protein J25TS5_51060 [Paenibacillus faecis]|nr:hypothetical protein J25TS5_51060 [Paenibacillus faecis]